MLSTVCVGPTRWTRIWSTRYLPVCRSLAPCKAMQVTHSEMSISTPHLPPGYVSDTFGPTEMPCMVLPLWLGVLAALLCLCSPSGPAKDRPLSRFVASRLPLTAMASSHSAGPSDSYRYSGTDVQGLAPCYHAGSSDPCKARIIAGLIVSHRLA